MRLISTVGDDAAGHTLLSHWRALGCRDDCILVTPRATTASVVALFDAQGGLHACVADCGIVESALGFEWVERCLSSPISQPPFARFDHNRHVIGPAPAVPRDAPLPPTHNRAAFTSRPPSTTTDSTNCSALKASSQCHSRVTVASRPGGGKPLRSSICPPPALVVLDANMTEAVLLDCAQWCSQRGVPVFFEPVSVAKSVRCVRRVREPVIKL